MMRLSLLCSPPNTSSYLIARLNGSGHQERLGRTPRGLPPHTSRRRPPRGELLLLLSVPHLACHAAPPHHSTAQHSARFARGGISKRPLICLLVALLQALTPLTIGRSRAKSAVLGSLWGAGHSTGQLFLGLLMVLLKDRFNALMPALTKWGGTMVGLTLLAIGFMGIYEAYFEKHEEEDENEELAAIGESYASACAWR